MYDNGQGVPQNYAEAVKWYRLAADQGDAGAQYNLGVMYDQGRGVPQNYAEAVKWYRLAADQGDAIAQYNLGVMYDKGQGVPQNYAEAVKWYRLAADQGYAGAQYNLGVMYDKGRGRAAELRRGREVVSPRRRPGPWPLRSTISASCTTKARACRRITSAHTCGSTCRRRRAIKML